MIIEKLVLINYPNTSLTAILKRINYKNFKILYWADGWIDREGLIYWVENSNQVIIQDDIISLVSPFINTPITQLSDYLAEINGRKQKNSFDNSKKSLNSRIFLFAANDTIAMEFSKMSIHLDNSCFVTPGLWKNEKAEECLKNLGINSLENYSGILDDLRPSVVVFGNDWSPDSIELIQKARKRGIPSVCIQEGCLDFQDEYHRMEWADYAFIQGPIMIEYLDRDSYFITGNPRFDYLAPQPFPAKPIVMINSNFTYGIHEDIRDEWIHTTSNACKLLGLDYFISKHPRDQGEFLGHPVRDSNATIVHNHLIDATVLITRFSTLVYEALMMGRPVIYFNPHHERMKLFNDDTTGGIYSVYNSDDLGSVLHNAISQIESNQSFREKFLKYHCGMHDGNASRRCAESLKIVSRSQQTASDKLDPKKIFPKPLIKRINGRIRRILRDISNI
jgi:hypothetical protein